MTNIPPLARRSRSLGAEVVAHLTDLLMSGQLKPGDRVPSERALAESLDVSRATIRQALAELEARGHLIRRHGRGTIVAERAGLAAALSSSLGSTGADWQQIADLEDLIEPGVARRAARRATEAMTLLLEDLLGRAAETSDVAASAAVDREFHLALAEATGNPLLAASVGAMRAPSDAILPLVHETSIGREVALAGHWAILQAVVARDGSAAAAAMARHLEEVRRVVKDAQRRA
ncbi:FadR/GntR family transcriptional regulator [Microbacterium sp. Marseille-Q6965]|uniref:FadR/GntR family transcriptional regulator n=1 Tax=Microbacterium sp. Marseille-Q6965 TaxID=2965072 RepID=UPI0021B7308E|nr:FCD domain-containing protein [Microbacterium sp. Marseille-Q6965]